MHTTRCHTNTHPRASSIKAAGVEINGTWYYSEYAGSLPQYQHLKKSFTKLFLLFIESKSLKVYRCEVTRSSLQSLWSHITIILTHGATTLAFHLIEPSHESFGERLQAALFVTCVSHQCRVDINDISPNYLRWSMVFATVPRCELD